MEAAFFDLDKTVIAKASLMAFGRPFYREGLISRSTVMRGLWTQLIYLHLGASDQKLTRVRESVLSLTKGWEQHRVRQIVADALERVVEPITYVEALELIDAPPGGRTADLPDLGLTGRDRRAARALPRRRRVAGQPGPHRP